MAINRFLGCVLIAVATLMIQARNPARIYRTWQEGQFALLICAEHLDELPCHAAQARDSRTYSALQPGGLVNEIKTLAEGVDSLSRVRANVRC
jgi:hypothetical protein